MDIDLSPLTSTLNTMVLYMATILVVPIIVALVIGFILIKLKIWRIIVLPIMSLSFVLGIIQMFKLMEFNF